MEKESVLCHWRHLLTFIDEWCTFVVSSREFLCLMGAVPCAGIHAMGSLLHCKRSLGGLGIAI